MAGGRQDRSSQCYSFKKQKWELSPKLPLGHNITTFIAVNYKDKAVFTFVIDAQMTIKSAVLDLERAQWTDIGTENRTPEMQWALQWPQSEHKMDRLHVKTAIALDDDRIAVLARGRTEGMTIQVSGLVIYFRVV